MCIALQAAAGLGSDGVIEMPGLQGAAAASASSGEAVRDGRVVPLLRAVAMSAAEAARADHAEGGGGGGGGEGGEAAAEAAAGAVIERGIAQLLGAQPPPNPTRTSCRDCPLLTLCCA